MSRAFTMVSPQIWTSKNFRALSSRAQLMFLFLLTSQHTTSAGCYHLPLAYAAADLDWEQTEVEKAIQDLVDLGMVAYDKEARIVLVKKWFRHSGPKSASHMKGIKGTLERLHSPLADEALFEAEEAWGDFQIKLEARKAAKGGARQDNSEASGQQNAPVPEPHRAEVSHLMETRYMSRNR